MLIERSKNTDAKNIIVIPTCVERQTRMLKKYDNNSIIRIVWMGGDGNQYYLNNIVEDFNVVNERYKIELLVISGKEYHHSKAQFPILNIKWDLSHQYQNLLTADIGIMPLEDTDVDKGKCGFKLLQYMSVGLVSIADPITVNKEILSDEENGFVNASSWAETLIKTIEMKDKWIFISDNALVTIQNRYSFEANTNQLISFLQ